jgi:hypothetical protein
MEEENNKDKKQQDTLNNEGQEKSGPIDSLKADLYRKDKPVVSHTNRSRLNRSILDVRDNWQDNVDGPVAPPLKNQEKMRTKQHSFVKKFLIFSVIFFVAAAGIASYLLFGGRTVVSSQNVDIAVTGPVSIDGGEVLALQVDVKNNNATTLEVVDLLVEYPDGTRNAEDVSRELVRNRETLGNISPRETVTRVLKSVLFGEEGSKQQIKLTIEYRVAGSNAIFFKERVYEVEIRSAPLTLTIDTAKSVNAGQEMEMLLELRSNATIVLSDVLLIAEYPFGFTYNDASQKPEFDDRIWEFGDIEPGGVRTLRISGVLEGQDTEERIFRFEAGTQSEKDLKKIATPFLTIIKGLVIERPFIDVNLVFDGAPGALYVAKPGAVVRADVVWRNNLPNKLSDATIEVMLNGSVLDIFSVSARNGFFQSGNKTILWDSRDNAELGIIDAGTSGQVSFSFSSLGSDLLAQLTEDPQIDLSVVMKAQSLSNDTQKTITISSSEKVLVETDIGLSSRAVHFVGPINNSGPIPPQVGKETTYTVTWSLTNSHNDLSNTEVTAIIPSYIRYVGLVSPSSESLSFNPVGGEVTWNVGELEAGAGFSTSPREVSFQVALVPSVSQIGSAPILTGDTTVSGVDRFTKSTVTGTAIEISTRMTTDPQYMTGNDRVIE